MKINNHYLVREKIQPTHFTDIQEWKLIEESKKAYKFEGIVRQDYFMGKALTIFWVLKSAISEDGNCKYWVIDEIEK